MKIKKLHTNFLSMLGAPLRVVEITEDHVKVAVDEANKTFDLYYALSNRNNTSILLTVKDIWIEKYVYASLKETLGNIRGKFSGTAITPDGDLVLEYKTLLRTGYDEKQKLTSLLIY